MNRKLISCLSTLVLLLASLFSTIPVMAAETCSIAIIPVTVEDNTTIIKGHSFELYQVASVDHGVYKLTDNFKDLDADLTSWEADKLSSSVTDYVKEHNVCGISQQADAGGVVAFDDLSIGLYYVAQNNTVSGYDQVVPFMVTLPYKAPDGTGYTYDVKAYPKVEPSEDQPGEPGEPGEPTDPDEPGTPDNPEQPGEDEKPGTTPGGSDTPGGSTTGGGTTSGGGTTGGSTSGGGTTSSGGNGYDAEESNPVTSVVETVQETLAQTGMLIWPIFALAGFGILLVLVGMYNVKKGKKEQEQNKGDARS